jgi:Fe-S-cluster-containing hydrogenase component 2
MSVKVNSEKCTGCGVCKDTCPVDAIEIKNAKAVISDSCLDCGACVPACPQKALTL